MDELSPPEEGRRRLLVSEEDAGGRLDQILGRRLPVSRSCVARLADAGRVTVNGRARKKRYRPRPGDLVEIELPRPAGPQPAAEDIPVEVRYEDECLAVVEKPAGLVVHPAPGHRQGTLVNALLFRLGRLSSAGGPSRPGIVHRLDKDTSGLMLVAKRNDAHAGLSAQLQRREVRREYLACAWGHLGQELVTVDKPLGRHPRDRRRRAARTDGRPAVTHFKRLERWNAADLLAVRLETGRTHQIRVHLESIGHPVVADSLYGAGREKGFGGAGGRWAEAFARRAGRLFLHAAQLEFDHPETGRKMSFSSALPPSLQAAAEWARATS